MPSALGHFPNCHRSLRLLFRTPTEHHCGDCHLDRPGARRSPGQVRNANALRGPMTAKADGASLTHATPAAALLIFRWCRRVAMSKIRAMIWVMTTAVIRIGSDRS